MVLCEAAGCTKRPCFDVAGGKGRFCTNHKAEGMDVNGSVWLRRLESVEKRLTILTGLMPSMVLWSNGGERSLNESK